MLIADLSIDFDFFSRELDAWDFDCDDTEHHRVEAWRERYAEIDLQRETCIDSHADFAPEEIMEALASKGIQLLGDRRRCRIGIADSHHHAYAFFRDSIYLPDLILNLDAHHDCFDDVSALHCGNWGHRIQLLAPDFRFVQVYPSWKHPSGDAPPVGAPEIHRWQHWPGFAPSLDVRIRHIFLCRSAGWLPPHHDARFHAFADLLGGFGRARWIEPVPLRQVA